MKRNRQRQTGFTLLDVATASVMTAVLAMLISSTWALFIKPTSSLIAWGKLFQEMDIAVTTMARDLGGSLPDTPTGNKRAGLLLACKTENDLTYGDHLLLCFDGGTTPDGVADWSSGTDDTIIDYYVDPATHTLYRQNKKTNKTVVVASNVESPSEGVGGMTITDDPLDGTNLQIQLAFTHHYPGETSSRHWMTPLSRGCTLIVKKSP